VKLTVHANRPKTVRALTGVITVALVAAGTATIAEVPSAIKAPTSTKPAAKVTSAPNEMSALVAAARQHSPVTIDSSLTSDSVTVANPDGSLTLHRDAGPVRVRQADGSWANVDLNWQAAGGHVVETMPATAVTLSGGGDSTIASVAAGDGSIDVNWDGQLPTPFLNGTTATYPDVRPGVDLVVQALRRGFEVSFVIHDRPTHALSLPLRMRLHGLKAAHAADGSLEVTDSRGKVVADGTVPVMFGAAIDPVSRQPIERKTVSGVLSAAAADPTSPRTSDQTWSLAPDMGFLSDPSVTYPVTVDPSFSVGSGSDTWVKSDVTTSEYNNVDLWIGTPDSGTTKARTYFHNGSIPSQIIGKYIDSASLNLYNVYSSTCGTTGTTVYLYRMNSSSSWTSNTVWSTKPSPDTSQVWQNAFHYAGNACPGAGEGSVPITSLVQDWASGTNTIRDWQLSASETDTRGWKEFYSGNAPDHLPYISITYRSYPGTPGTPSITPATGTGPSGYWTSTTTPTLAASVSDPDGTSVRGLFQIYNGGSLVWSGYSAYVASGGTASLSVPAGYLSDNTSYTVRVYGDDGTIQSQQWSSYIQFKADDASPSTPVVSSAGYTENVWTDTTGPSNFTFSSTDTGGSGIDHFLYDWDTTAPQQSTGVVTSPYTLSLTPPTGWHILTVVAVDVAGLQSPPYEFAFGNGAHVTSPADGADTAGTVTLGADAAAGYTGVTYNYSYTESGTYVALPVGDVSESNTTITSWPIAVPSGSTSTAPRLSWNVAGTLGGIDGPVWVEACFTNATDNVCSPGVQVLLDQTGGSADTTSVGPASVNLQTGGAVVGANDVSIDTPGGNLSVTRAANSMRTAVAPTGGVNQIPANAQDVETTLTDFTPYQATVSAAASPTTSGSDSLQLNPATGTDASSDNTFAYVGGSSGGLRLGMQPGHTYVASARIYVPSATGLSPTYTWGEQLVATFDSTSVASNRPTATDTWQNITEQFTVPTTATQAYLRVFSGFDRTLTANAIYLDDFSLTEVGPFGPGWDSSLPSSGSQSGYTGLNDTGNGISISRVDGSEMLLTRKTLTTWVPTGDDADSGLVLSVTTFTGWPNPYATGFKLTDPERNAVFFNEVTNYGAYPTSGAPHRYNVSTVTPAVDSADTSYTYDAASGHVVSMQTHSVGQTCSVAAACFTLDFAYGSGVSAGRVTAITYVTGTTSVDVACYAYDGSGNLTEAWDPRNVPSTTSGTITCNPSNQIRPTEYQYDSSGRLTMVKPGALQEFRFTYDSAGRLLDVGRTHSGTNPGTENTTIVYGVPLAADPNALDFRPDLTATSVATWGQTDIPEARLGGTAVCPPYTSGSPSPTADLRDCAISYLDADGRAVNTASYEGTGASGWHIGTSEYDSSGDLIRTLSAADREEALNPTGVAGTALGLPTDTAAAAVELDTVYQYAVNTDGLSDLTDTFGPYHLVTLPSGSVVAARAHSHRTYDDGSELGHPAGGTMHLMTSRYEAASQSPTSVATNEADIRQTNIAYALSASDATGWTFSEPMQAVVDPGTGGLNITATTRYDSVSGLQIETRMPTDASGGGGGTTLTYYYTASTNTGDSNCSNHPEWVNLVCETIAANTSPTSSLPSLVATRYVSYDYLDRATEVDETATPAGGSPVTRVSKTVYGFNSTITSGVSANPYATTTESSSVTGGVGTAVPSQTITYDSATGLRTGVSDGTNSDQVVYDDFGRVTSYTENTGATGNQANVTSASYDVHTGYLLSSSDAHTTTTYGYGANGEHRGKPTSASVSVNSSTAYSGTFTATYGPDGSAASESDPNGVTTTYTHDEIGELTALDDQQSGTSYLTPVPTGNGGRTEVTSWNIHRERVADAGPLGAHSYAYDADGRLSLTFATPQGGACTAVGYAYDADSNRTSSTSYTGVAGACPTQPLSGGTSVAHSYDGGDRLLPSGNDTGLVYDAFGNITAVPAADVTGGAALNVNYFASDMVQSETQGATTQTWTLDAEARLSGSVTTVSGSVTATKTNHYDSSESDSPAWISESADGSQWLAAIDGPLGFQLTVDQSGTATYMYEDLHGDIIATSCPAVSSGAPLLRPAYGEFGTNASTDLYAWLGSAQRSQEDLGGLVLMGVRLYAPLLGRFLQVDPEPGGAANPYDYAEQDPVNNRDLNGEATIYCPGVPYRCYEYQYKWITCRICTGIGGGSGNTPKYLVPGYILNYCPYSSGCISGPAIKNLAVRVTCLDWDDGDCFIDMRLHTSYGGHADNKFNLPAYYDGWAYYAVRGNSTVWWAYDSYSPSSCVFGFFCSSAAFSYQVWVKVVVKVYV
jgi:RHS repeat-associated protein